MLWTFVFPVLYVIATYSVKLPFLNFFIIYSFWYVVKIHKLNAVFVTDKGSAQLSPY